MSTVRDEVLAANAAYTAEFGDKGNLPMLPGRGSPSSPVWMPGWIRPSSLVWQKVMRMSFATPVDVRAMTPSGPW